MSDAVFALISRGVRLAVVDRMRSTTSFMLSFALAAGLAAAPAAAASHAAESQARGGAHAAQGQKPRPKPKAVKERKAEKRQDKQDRADRNGRAIDRDGYVRVIRDYERRGLPPGLAKRDELPPGLRRQLRERGTLPPGLEKHLVRVPDDWSSRLPSIRRYERRYFAGDDLLVVDTRTNRIVALIRDVLR